MEWLERRRIADGRRRTDMEKEEGRRKKSESEREKWGKGRGVTGRNGGDALWMGHYGYYYGGFTGFGTAASRDISNNDRFWVIILVD